MPTILLFVRFRQKKFPIFDNNIDNDISYVGSGLDIEPLFVMKE